MTHINREELAGRLDSYSLVAPTRGMSHALTEAAAALRQSPTVEEVARVVWPAAFAAKDQSTAAARRAVAEAYRRAHDVFELFEGRGE